MTANKPLVIIKGVKEGLFFLLDEEAPFPEVVAELNHKLTHSHGQFLFGPITHVHVRTGKRIATEEIHHVIRESFSYHGNLLVQSIQSDGEEYAAPPQNRLTSKMPTVHLVSRIVRSGDVVQEEGDVLVVGDVNAGGMVVTTGNIYIMGCLRGIAHAGYGGYEDKIIVAVIMEPTQLRIGALITRAPDERTTRVNPMEFAYGHEGRIHVANMSQLQKLRPQNQYSVGRG